MRSRNIKPGFLANEDLAALPPLARILYAGLWMACDREGRTEDRPRRIKALLLPYDDCDVDELLWLLHESKFLIRYKIGENGFLWMPTFLDHQKPHPRESNSQIPAFSEEYRVPRKGIAEPCKGLPKALPSPAESLNPESLNPESKPLLGKPEPSQSDLLIAKYAPAIHRRHVARKCSLKTVCEKLKVILAKTKLGHQVALMEQIDGNHQACCQSEAWSKDGGQFCPGLDKWLNPKQERYLIPPDEHVSNGHMHGIAGDFERYFNEHPD